MKARSVCIDGTRCYLGEEELPPLKDSEFLVRTSMSLPSVGTETAVLNGHGWPGKHLGYSNVGRVEAVGPGVTKYKVGDRLHTMAAHTDRFIFAEPDAGTYRIPGNVSDADATFATLGTVALHQVERAQIALGQPVVVIGQGAVGLLTAQFARRAGAGAVIGVDLDEKRRQRALALGIDAAIAPDTSQLRKILDSLPPDHPATTFIEVSGAVPAVKWALEAAELRSRIVLGGTYMAEVAFDPFVFIEKELDVVGAHQPKCPELRGNFYPHSRVFNYALFFRALADGWLKVAPLVDGVLKGDQIIVWYNAVKSRQPRLGQPIFDWQ